MAVKRILLLTNRDSDNVGDQVIEATAIAIIDEIMGRLGHRADGYRIISRSAGIIPKKFIRSGDPALLDRARKLISNASLVVFGGAPLFNYSYQNFYLRTIKTLELAQEYGTPVIFSSIGVEPFDSENEKCLALKEALSLPCVRQITTRDDFDSLQSYVADSDTPVAHVADPAVFADIVFRNAAVERKVEDGTPKTIGLVVSRAELSRDNGIEFTEENQRRFWLEVISDLESRGDDYRVFTTGHFSDEVFLDALLRESSIPPAKVAVTVNSPEELIGELLRCDGVIAYRLHASITCYAFGIPSIGLSWNFKIPYFYRSIGYGERALNAEDWRASTAIGALDKAMRDGVTRDEEHAMTVYTTLFHALRDVLNPESMAQPADFDQLRNHLPAYAGTSHEQYRAKINRKLRRTYENYQRLQSDVERLESLLDESATQRAVRRSKRVLGTVLRRRDDGNA